MPLIGDSKSVYVGTTPITAIMAGSVQVWGVLQLRVVNFIVSGSPGTYLGAEFSEREECADCAEMKSTYQYRYTQSGVWTAWQQFYGWTTVNKGYIYLGVTGDSRFDNSIFELRTNGKTQQITIDLSSVPNIGTITPTLTCT